MAEYTKNLNLEKIAPGTKPWYDKYWANLDKIDANNPKHNFSATAAPTPNDDSSQGYNIGSIWIDTANKVVYQCVDATEGAAVWEEFANNSLSNVSDSTVLNKVKNVDGSGSGLDADKLDGLEGKNFIKSLAVAGALSDIDLNTLFETQTVYFDGSCSSKPSPHGGYLIVIGNSVNRTGQFVISQDGNVYFRKSDDGSTWSSWNKIWHAGNDGSGSGLDADKLDGLDSSQFVRNDIDNSVHRTINFLDTTSVIQFGDFVKKYHRTYTVNVNSPAVLVDNEGNPFDLTKKTYLVKGYTVGTGTISGAVAVFWKPGSGNPVVQHLFRKDIGSNNVNFFIDDNGQPSVSTWHTSDYNVTVYVEEYLGNGTGHVLPIPFYNLSDDAGVLKYKGNVVWHQGNQTISKASNGYQKLPNGLIIQWGYVPDPGDSSYSYITFPIAFPNAVFSFTLGLKKPSDDDTSNAIALIISLSTTSAVVDSACSVGQKKDIFWQAIGY